MVEMYFYFSFVFSIWNNTVLIQAKTHYNKVKFSFEGINWMNIEPVRRDTLDDLIFEKGDRFYIQRTDKMKSIWGVNVMEIKEEEVIIEFFPFQN